MATAELEPAPNAAPPAAHQAEPTANTAAADPTSPDAAPGTAAGAVPSSKPKKPRDRRVPPRTSPATKKACAKCFRVLPLTDYRWREETLGWNKPRLQSYCKACQRMEKADRDRRKGNRTAFRDAATAVGTDPSLRKVRATIEMLMEYCGGGPNEVAALWHANLEQLANGGRSPVEVTRQIGMLVVMANFLPDIDTELSKQERQSAGVTTADLAAALAGASDADLDRIAGAVGRELMRRQGIPGTLGSDEYVDPADLAADIDERPGSFDPTADDPAYQTFERQMEREHQAAAERELERVLGGQAAGG